MRIGWILCAVLVACGGDDADVDDPQCGGCALPPVCNADGTAPPAPCSCGCVEGQRFAGGVCTAAGCLDPDAPTCDSPPFVPVSAPSATEWIDATAELPAGNDGISDPFPLTVDPASCQPGRYFIALGLGSAFADVVPVDGVDECQVWLGGETENPMYDGTPTQYCRLPAGCAPVVAVHLGDSGPARIDSPYCVTPGVAE